MFIKTFGMRLFSIGETLPLFVTDVFSERKGFNCFDCQSLLRILDRFSEGEESARFIAQADSCAGREIGLQLARRHSRFG